MARIHKSTLTRLEIIQEATKQFIENSYTETTCKSICKELEMSPGNVTFYFHTKEHLLAELVDLLCKFQWKIMEQEADEGISSIMAICLELTAMATMCEDDPIAKDIYISAYTSPLCLEIIRKNDSERAKQVFRETCSDWTEEQFAVAEILVSGIEYATLMTTDTTVSLEMRLAGALNQILEIYGIPEERRKAKIQKVFTMDYHNIGKRVLQEFKEYVKNANEQAINELLKR